MTKLRAAYLTVVGATQFSLSRDHAGVNRCLNLSMVMAGAIGPWKLYVGPVYLKLPLGSYSFTYVLETVSTYGRSHQPCILIFN